MKKITVRGLKGFSPPFSKGVVTPKENEKSIVLSVDWVTPQTMVELEEGEFYFPVLFNFDSEKELREELIREFQEFQGGKPQTFGAFLKQRREKEGVRQDHLAESIGISKSMLSMIESGDKPPPDSKTISKLAFQLGDFGKDDEYYFLARRIPEDMERKIFSDLETFRKLRE